MQDAGFSEELDKEEFGIVSAAGIGGLPNIEKKIPLFVPSEVRVKFPLFHTFSTCKYVRRFDFYRAWT